MTTTAEELAQHYEEQCDKIVDELNRRWQAFLKTRRLKKLVEGHTETPADAVMQALVFENLHIHQACVERYDVETWMYQYEIVFSSAWKGKKEVISIFQLDSEYGKDIQWVRAENRTTAEICFENLGWKEAWLEGQTILSAFKLFRTNDERDLQDELFRFKLWEYLEEHREALYKLKEEKEVKRIQEKLTGLPIASIDQQGDRYTIQLANGFRFKLDERIQ